MQGLDCHRLLEGEKNYHIYFTTKHRRIKVSFLSKTAIFTTSEKTVPINFYFGNKNCKSRGFAFFNYKKKKSHQSDCFICYYATLNCTVFYYYYCVFAEDITPGCGVILLWEAGLGEARLGGVSSLWPFTTSQHRLTSLSRNKRQKLRGAAKNV